MFILETERLILEEFTAEDASFILSLLNSPDWLHNIGDRNVKSEADALQYIEEKLQSSYKQYGYGLYLVKLKSGTKIGMCGLVKRDYLDAPDIGFAMLPEHTNKGYGYESSLAVLAYAQKELNEKIILGITLPTNQASIKLLEKIGLLAVEKFSPPGDTDTLLLFSNEKS